MPVIAHHASQLLRAAYTSRDRARATPDQLSVDCLHAIVMSAAACEAFVNELAELVRALEQNSALAGSVSRELSRCSAAIRSVESERGPITLKYLVASLMLSGDSFNEGAQPYQDFDALIRLRNAIMHLRPGNSGAEKIAAALAQRGIAFQVEPNVWIAWLDQISTPAVATWACNAARRIILALLAMTPDTDPPQLDPLHGQKWVLRDDARFPA